MSIAVTITGRQLLDMGKWGDACDLLGLNPWIINEGQMDSDESVILNHQQAWTLGLINIEPPVAANDTVSFS